MKELTHLSLFSGIGGLDLAAEWAGFKTVGQCEWADYPTKVLEKHWPDVPRWRDIRTLTKEDFYARTGRRTVDVVSGGFPCQPFSVAGNQKGKGDERYLWPEMLRVIRELAPRWVIGENVPGIIKLAGRTVCEDLEREGYAVAVLNFEAAAVGAPHRRKRVFFVAHRDNGFGDTAHEEIQAGRYTPYSCGTAMENAHSVGCRQSGVLPQQPRGTESISAGKDSAVRPGTEMRTVVADTNSGQGYSRDEFVARIAAHAQFGTDSAGEGRAVADADSGRCAHGQHEVNTTKTGKQAQREFTQRSNYVGNPECPRRPRPNGIQKSAIITQSSKDVSDTESPECQGQWGEAWGWRSEFGCDSRRPTEPRLGGMVDGIPHGLDGHWRVEPDIPRVATGIKKRVDRLKCLGNAVVPQQAYPIFRAIAEIERRPTHDLPNHHRL